MTQNIPYRYNPFPIYIRGSIEPLHQPLTFKGLNSINAVKLGIYYGYPYSINLKYRKNSGNWTAYTTGTIIELNQNETVAFSGANEKFSMNGSNCYQFVMTGTVEASGNIQSLMNFSDSCPSGCYNNLFLDCSNLITPPLLPATTLCGSCYTGMFYRCSNLTTAPKLPATTLAINCYNSMFSYCTSLTAAP